jgi:type II secretory pathway component PulF
MAKFNARFFGGAGLFLIFLIIIIPIWAGVLESGITEIPANLVQTESEFPNSPATIPLLTIMVISFIAFVFLYKEKRRRARS